MDQGRVTPGMDDMQKQAVPQQRVSGGGLNIGSPPSRPAAGASSPRLPTAAPRQTQPQPSLGTPATPRPQPQAATPSSFWAGMTPEAHQAWSRIPIQMRNQYYANYQAGRTQMPAAEALKYYQQRYGASAERALQQWQARYGTGSPSFSPETENFMATVRQETFRNHPELARQAARLEAARREREMQESVRQELAANPAFKPMSAVEREQMRARRAWGPDMSHVLALQPAPKSFDPLRDRSTEELVALAKRHGIDPRKFFDDGPTKTMGVKPPSEADRAAWEERNRQYRARRSVHPEYRQWVENQSMKTGAAQVPPSENGRMAFKFGFLLRCIDEGLTPEQIRERVAIGLGPEAIEKTAAWGQDTLNAVLKTWLLPVAVLTTLGAGVGYAAGGLQDSELEPEDVKTQELIAAYQAQADRLRRAAARYALRQASPPPKLPTL